MKEFVNKNFGFTSFAKICCAGGFHSIQIMALHPDLNSWALLTNNGATTLERIALKVVS
jgi:hypothetical protein